MTAPLGSNRHRVIEALASSTRPLDDDEVARRAGIRPRQTVNQLCRSLEAAGQLRRGAGPDGKIVNVLTDPSSLPSDASAVDREPEPVEQQPEEPTANSAILTDEAPPGSSTEQRDAERVMLDLLGARLGVRLDPMSHKVQTGPRVEVDGADIARSVLVECWAHQGPPKPAQRNKVLADGLKLSWIASTMYPRPQLVLCLSDSLAAAPFLPTAKSWSAQALADLNITIEVVELPSAIREGIVAAQKRQYR